jgi:hypothetical protein
VKNDVVKMWVEANLRSIVEEGKKFLQFSAEDGFYKKAALEVADEIAKSSPSMLVFQQRFWTRYLLNLKNNGQPAPMLSICEEAGNLIAVIIFYEEVQETDEVKEEAA